MEVVILMAIIGTIVFFVKRTFGGFVYSIAVVDIFLRLIAYLKVHLFTGDVAHFFIKYFPNSIPAIIEKYTSSTLENVLIWIYVGIMIIFECYIIRTFFHKK
ncbi:MAG: hypothetical protein E7165_01935 [Firmicutes bacterium]|nr:hypothetical protein [Bacillota bacterium]